LPQLGDPGLGDHPAVSDHDEVRDAEIIANPGDGGCEGDRVAGVAGKNLDRDRPPHRIGEQPVLNLFAAAFPVPGIPERSQFALGCFHPRGGQIKHGNPTSAQMAAASPFSIWGRRDTNQSMAV
jgi:hypothetical protein